jgi:DNA polymerase III subunit gamma/tau
MSYEITATRKRPQIFEDLVDQEFVVATLASSIKQGRIAHAYLFSGPRGVGKTSAARILAKALNCEKGPTDHPCGKCSTCSEITTGNSLDVIEIDGASNTSVNDIREIKDEVLFAPNSSKYKVYIIDEVHMLSNSAFNALLKTIEEPPPYIVFIFATTEIHKVPATIRSRCQQFNFRLISMDGIKENLKKVALENNITADDDALFWIAKESTGSLRDAQTLFDQVIAFSKGNVTLSVIKEKLGIVGTDELNEIFTSILSNDTKKVLELTHSILTKGISIEQYVIDFTEYLRNLLFIKHGIKKDSILGFSSSSFLQDNIEKMDVPQIELGIELFLNLFRNLRYTLNPTIELDLAMSRFSNLNNMITQNQITQEIASLKTEILELSDKPKANNEAPVVIQESNPPEPNNREHLLEEIIKTLHTLNKLALASALEKAETWKMQSDELCLVFTTKNKFQGEMVKKDKKEVISIASTILSSPIKLNVAIINPENTEVNEKDDRVTILKNIFNGEVVQGE